MLDRPILYENTSEPTNTLGLGVMTGLREWRIKSERNMIPLFTGSQDIKNYLTPDIKNDRVIMADASHKRLNQLFKIDKITDKVDTRGVGVRQIEAHHIAGELIKNSITGDIMLVNANPKQLWNALMKNLSATDISSKFTFHTDIATTANVNLKWQQVNNLQDVLFGQGSTGANGTDSFIKLYNGEWKFDNFDIYFLKKAGEDNGLIIQYGQNLKSLSQEESILNTYTAVQGYATQQLDEPKANPITDATDYTGTGLVQYLGNGGLIVYQSPNGLDTGQRIQNGQHIALSKQYVDGDNIEWLQLTDGNWVQGKHVVVDKKGSWIADNVTGSGHIKWNISSDGQSNIYETVNGVMVADYINGDIPVYTQPTKDSTRTSSLDKNISRWKVFYKTKDNDGLTWYCLGTNQWVSNQYVQFDKQSTYTYENARGVGTVDHDTKNYHGTYEGVAIWTQPHYGSPSSVVKYVYHNQRYQIFKVANNNGNTWYNLGGNQWIDGQYMRFDTNNRDVKPQAPSEFGNSNMPTPRYAGKVVVYDHPGWEQQPTGTYLYSGDSVRILSQARVENGIWYQTEQGWINGDYVDFGRDEDVTPYDPSQDIVVETKKEKVTLTLPDTYIKAPLADQYENLKILKQDFTEYHIDTVDKLKAVTQAFIYDKRIGEPETNLDIEYYQMLGELEHLTAVDLCDSATIHFEKLDLNKTAEVTSCEWNGEKQRWESIHFGKKPETLRDTLDKYLYKANTDTKIRVERSQKKLSQTMDKSINIMWDKFHDDAARTLGDFNSRLDQTWGQLNNKIGQTQDDLNGTINSKWGQLNDQIGQTASDLNGRIGQTESDLNGKIQQAKDELNGNISQAKGELNETLGGFRREFAKGYSDLSAELRDTKVITQQQIDTAIKNYRESAEQEVQRIKDNMADYVQRHVEDGKIEYGTNKISATTNDGHHIEFGAGGIISTDANGKPTNIWTSAGGLNTDLLNAKTITGLDLYSATIHTGVIDAGVEIQAPRLVGVQIDGDSFIRSANGGDYTVMSAAHGFSTTSGLSVGGETMLQGGLGVMGRGYFASGITLGAAGSSYISLGDGSGSIQYYGGRWRVSDANGSHAI